MEQRDSTIDLLRVFGTFLVILAHVKIPEFISEVRTFDVVLLVFISGMSLRYANYKHYFAYMKKRVKKLLYPAWTTVSIVLLCLFVGDKVIGPFSILNWRYIVHSFFLIDADSIGAVWIVKVYLLIALLTPIIDFLEKKIDSSVALMGGGYFVILVFSFLVRVVPTSIFVQEYVIYAVQYSIVALFGLRFVKQKKSGIVLGMISFFALVCCVISAGSFEPSLFKYPPQIYYLSYGLLCSIFFYGIVSYLKKYIIVDKKLVFWLSTHSFTIYICHIYYLWLFFALAKLGIRLNYLVEFVILIIASIGQTIVLEKMKERIKMYFVKFSR